jgi:hypothetical protein
VEKRCVGEARVRFGVWNILKLRLTSVPVGLSYRKDGGYGNRCQALNPGNLKNYDLGLVDLEKKQAGFRQHQLCHPHRQDGQRARYFLRKYKPSIREASQFEHSLINHLLAAGSPPVARVYLTRQGETYLRHSLGMVIDRAKDIARAKVSPGRLFLNF